MTTGRVDLAPDTQLIGRDLDAAVAERVMGWALIDAKGEDWFDTMPAEAFPIFVRWPEGGTAVYESQHDIRSLEFRPSESIEAAMQVVEKLAALCWRTHMSRHFIAPYWQVELFANEGDTWTRKVVESDSLPEAICHAALKAVGEKKG